MSNGIGCVDAQGGDRRQHAAKRNHGKDRQRRGHDHHRGEDEQPPIDVGRRVLFLEDHLQAVGQRLTEAQAGGSA